MNNPAKYNGWTDPMLRSWMGRFADAATDDSVKALILTGSGKYYCAGVDLSGTTTHVAEAAARPDLHLQQTGV